MCFRKNLNFKFLSNRIIIAHDSHSTFSTHIMYVHTPRKHIYIYTNMYYLNVKINTAKEVFNDSYVPAVYLFCRLSIFIFFISTDFCPVFISNNFIARLETSNDLDVASHWEIRNINIFFGKCCSIHKEMYLDFWIKL